MALASEHAEIEDLLAYVPEVSSISTERVSIALEDAKNGVDERWFGERTRYAHAMLAAHYLSLWTGMGGGESGPIASRSAGNISVSYAVSAPAAAELASTKYGRLFLQIAQSVAHAGVSA
jgi:hypothetical protein